jgi:hypothetical protein
MGRTMPSVRFADFSLKRITSGWATIRSKPDAEAMQVFIWMERITVKGIAARRISLRHNS